MIINANNIKELEPLELIEIPTLNYQIVLNSEHQFVGLFDEDLIIKERGIDGLFQMLEKFENQFIIDRLDSLFFENLIKIYPKNQITHLCTDCKNHNLVYGIPIDNQNIFCLHKFSEEINKNYHKYFLKNMVF